MQTLFAVKERGWIFHADMIARNGENPHTVTPPLRRKIASTGSVLVFPSITSGDDAGSRFQENLCANITHHPPSSKAAVRDPDAPLPQGLA